MAASGAALAGPAFGANTIPRNIDILIIGAGAAGIAAARRVRAENRQVAIIEAADHIGGRCVTDTHSFGIPFDRGAHWIHAPDINPFAKLAANNGFELYRAPPGQKIRVGRRNAREGELEQYFTALVRSNHAIREAARGKTDIACAQALPKDLSGWRSTVEFVLGPFSCGADLSEVSAFDFARAAERDNDAFCRQGAGSLLASLADGLPIQLATPVKKIDWGMRNRVEVQTDRGSLSARAVIVTVSTGVLAANTIKFDPELPDRFGDAIHRLKLGSYDHIAIDMPGNPLDLQSDDLIFEQAKDVKTAAMLANVNGTSLCLIEVAGSYGRELAAQGELAMAEFALDWLSGLYGTDVKKFARRAAVTRWNDNPWVLGAFSHAPPGGQPYRQVLMQPLRDRIFFAGEAAHETLWGTIGGAWESGERAAEAALKKLGFIAEPPPPRRNQRQRIRQ